MAGVGFLLVISDVKHNYILIRKRNAKKLKPHFVEKDLDGVLNDMANEYLQ